MSPPTQYSDTSNFSLSLLSLIPLKQHAIITKISHLSLTYETVVKFHSVPVNLPSGKTDSGRLKRQLYLFWPGTKVTKPKEKKPPAPNLSNPSSVSKRPKVSSALFFNYNTLMGLPYRVLVDTNFINFSI
ncbi:uncharacterized protein LOC126709854 isoform X2 [Quercus robur]|uniref:uncharacterized protein LOC126709854 isoform X2 n=1 Tax=Quercus robur TaxID=38942 RepID=UPI002162891C|nr:uncharacterized protein LOC126709854 isoform X2 [Quercus robur]